MPSSLDAPVALGRTAELTALSDGDALRHGDCHPDQQFCNPYVQRYAKLEPGTAAVVGARPVPVAAARLSEGFVGEHREALLRYVHG
jgi:hypothetical protein